jgi:uncharacterized protein (TIGR02145 family)
MKETIRSLWRERTTGGGGAQVNGLGMSATVLGDMGLPSTITSKSINEVTATSHTHELGEIDAGDISVANNYGALYNWYVTQDARNISSSNDFVVPTKAQFEALATYAGGYSVSGGKFKESGYSHWESPNLEATDEYGLKFLPSGYRQAGDGLFVNINKNGQIHFSDQEDAGNSRYVEHSYAGYSSDMDYSDKSEGRSIRLINPNTLNPDGYIGTYAQNNGVVIPTIVINGVEMTMYLNETKYRNGDWITGFDGGAYTPISNVDWAALTTEAMCYYGDKESLGGSTPTPLNDVLNDLQNQIDAIQPQIQSDWTQEDDTQPDFIKNKHSLGSIDSKDYWTGTQSAYDAIDPKDSNTIYFVEE